MAALLLSGPAKAPPRLGQPPSFGAHLQAWFLVCLFLFSFPQVQEVFIPLNYVFKGSRCGGGRAGTITLKAIILVRNARGFK